LNAKKSGVRFIADSTDCHVYQEYSEYHYQDEKGCLEVQQEFVLVDVVALAGVGHDLTVPLWVVLDVATAPVAEDTFEMQPNGDHYDVAETDHSPVQSYHHLQMNPRDVDQVAP
jgi:hypothetical protein